MSHFSEMKVDFQNKSEAELVCALEKVFGEGHVEVHEEGAALYGYQDDDRSKLSVKSGNYAPPCHIIIRRKHVGNASNDVGYRRTEDGSYVAYISDYDKGHNFSPSKREKVMQEYAARVAEKQLKSKGYTVKRSVTESGQVKITATKWG